MTFIFRFAVAMLFVVFGAPLFMAFVSWLWLGLL